MFLDVPIHRLIELIRDSLLSAERRRLAGWIDKICLANREALGKAYAGFLYRGEYYQQQHIPQGRYERPNLAYSLSNQMDAYLVDARIIAMDEQLIGQCLVALLQPCEEWQDVRDTLPECLSDTFPGTKTLHRTRAEAWTIAGNVRAERQYLKILPKIQLYSATKLIY